MHNKVKAHQIQNVQIQPGPKMQDFAGSESNSQDWIRPDLNQIQGQHVLTNLKTKSHRFTYR